MKYLPTISQLIVICMALLTAPACISVPKTTALDSSLPRTEINGYPFHTEVYGSEDLPTVIVVHGGPGGYFTYLRSLSALSDKYRVVFYDQRGAGLSPREGTEGYTIDGFIKDLDDMVNIYSKNGPVRLIGHSWGGMLVTAYVAKNPEKVSHAVIAEPAMLNKESAKEFTDGLKKSRSFLDNIKMVQYLASSLFVKTLDEHDRADYVMTKILGSVKDPPYMCEGEALPESFNSRAGFSSYETMIMPIMKNPELFNYNPLKGIEKYNGRLLLLSSQCSFIGYKFQEKHHIPLFPPSVRHVKIENTGHYMITTRAKQSLRIIREFFNE